MSDSDSDEFLTDGESGDAVRNAIKKCINMKPDMAKSQKSKAKLSSTLKSKLENCRVVPSVKQRSSSRLDDRKKMEDMFKDISCDFANLGKKLDVILDSMISIVDKVDSLENRVDEFELKLKKIAEKPTYAASVINPAAFPVSVDRIDKLEYKSSEDERKERLLFINFTHPNINNNHENLNQHVSEFLTHYLLMEPREIDSNLYVSRSPRANTVSLRFSDRKFKLFLFSARKRLRIDNPRKTENLFINDHLTSYNYAILKSLKSEKKSRTDAGLTSFDSVYTYEGKVFVKKVRSNSPNNSIHISNPKMMKKFLDELTPVQITNLDPEIPSTSTPNPLSHVPDV